MVMSDFVKDCMEIHTRLSISLATVSENLIAESQLDALATLEPILAPQYMHAR